VTSDDVVAFLDADTTAISPRISRAVLEPVLAGRADL
jgi:hypothetical protein